MSQEAVKKQSLDDLDTIVDVDAHLTESIEDITPYIDDKYEAVRKLIAETPDPNRDIFSATHPLPPYLQSEAPYYRKHIEDGVVPAKLSEMDEFGISDAILSPGLTGLYLPTVNNTRCAVGIMNGFNNWLLEEIVDLHQDRFHPAMVVAHQKPDIAAEEIDRMGNEDISGVLIPSTGVIPPLGHFRYDPIYEAAADNNLPVLLHGASTNTSHVFPLARIFNETYAEDHTMIHPFSQMWELISMMFQGVPERYPELEFIIQESGISWVPFLKWRMDDHYLELTHELPYVDKLPSEYIDDQFYFSTQPLGHTEHNPRHLAYIIEAAGPDNIMYSSDLPHPDFDPPEELFERIRAHFEAEEVENMMGKTAAQVFDI